VIPEGKVNMIACASEREAHFVCAFLNAPLVRQAYGACTSHMGRPALLPIAIPRWDAARWTHQALATLSARLHAEPTRLARVERLLDWLVLRALPA
jgi:hypothetical protein